MKPLRIPIKTNLPTLKQLPNQPRSHPPIIQIIQHIQSRTNITPRRHHKSPSNNSPEPPTSTRIQPLPNLRNRITRNQHITRSTRILRRITNRSQRINNTPPRQQSIVVIHLSPLKQESNRLPLTICERPRLHCTSPHSLLDSCINNAPTLSTRQPTNT